MNPSKYGKILFMMVKIVIIFISDGLNKVLKLNEIFRQLQVFFLKIFYYKKTLFMDFNFFCLFLFLEDKTQN